MPVQPTRAWGNPVHRDLIFWVPSCEKDGAMMSQISTGRKQGYMGLVVSGKKLAQIANKIYEIQYDTTLNCEIEDFLLIELSQRSRALEGFRHERCLSAIICEEGVGYEETDPPGESSPGGSIYIPTNFGSSWNRMTGIARAYRYNGWVYLSVPVIKRCITGESVDIAKFIRVFGNRLNLNVLLWQGKMNPPTDTLL